MKRITLTIAPSLLMAVKKICVEEGKTLRGVIEELISLGLKNRQPTKRRAFRPLQLHTQPMGRINFNDKDAEDLAVFDERAKEQGVSFEKVVKNLKRDGKI